MTSIEKFLLFVAAPAVLVVRADRGRGAVAPPALRLERGSRCEHCDPARRQARSDEGSHPTVPKRAREGPPVRNFDLIVLGSGAAGLSAALFVAAQGRRVLLAEKSEWIGGTTAMSGGCIWTPCNHPMASIGASDSAQDALRYIRAVAPPGWAASEEPLWQAFVDAGPKMLRFIEANSPLRLHVGGEPDPYLEAPGALRRGRNVSPRPFRFARLGAWGKRVRPSAMPYRLAYYEVTDTHLFARPSQAITRFGPQLLWRLATGQRAMGQALVGGLLAGCLNRSIRSRRKPASTPPASPTKLRE